MKRGKSYFLQEVAVQCLLHRKKVAYFSLEMSKKRVAKRLFSRISSTGKNAGLVHYPCFDCKKNQFNSCTNPKRTNRIRLVDKDGIKPFYTIDNKYKPCTICRGTKDYEVATWFTSIKRDAMETSALIKQANALTKMYGDNLRIISYPAGSANLSTIKNDLTVLEYTEDFSADCIIIDYADILKPEDTRVSDARTIANSTWLMLKQLADSRHVLVFTASQGNRKSMDKKNISATDIAEDIRKYAHIDRMLGLSQTEQEKKDGILRVSTVGDRDGSFHQGDQVILLQQRSVGQILLDSEMESQNNSVEYVEDFE
jgi:replicative DNA helicase